MKVNERKRISRFFFDFIQLKEYKYLRIIYLVAFISALATYLFGPNYEAGDTYSYLIAKETLLTGSLSHLRTPLYPMLLILIPNLSFVVLFQYIVFFVSIAYLHQMLKMLLSFDRLIFVGLLIYVCYPMFTFYHNQIIPESLCISLSSISAYYLLKFVKTGRASDCVVFHVLMLCMIFLKPGCVFLFSVSVILLAYLLFIEKKKRKTATCALALAFVLLCIGGYVLSIKKEYGVCGISSVSAINQYWMMRDKGLINTNLIVNTELKEFVSEKIKTNYNKTPWVYFDEANHIIGNYGWGELDAIVENSLKKSHETTLFHIKNIIGQLTGEVGNSGSHFQPKSEFFIILFKIFPQINFYHLIIILFFYILCIIKSFLNTRKIPILSVLLLVYTASNFASIIIAAPNNYGRLIALSISIILLIVMQCIEYAISFIKKEENQLILK